MVVKAISLLVLSDEYNCVIYLAP